jgi:site-specific DNA-methyltransferase (adenine-specific)
MKYGDIVELGVHRLACGSATDSTLMDKIIGTDKVHLLLCDPPYAVALVESKSTLSSGARHKVIQNDHLQSDKEYSAFTKTWLDPIVPHLAKKNTIYIFNSDKMLFALRDGMSASGVRFSQLLIWVKTQAVIGRLDYLPQHELIAYGWYGTHEFMHSKDKSVLVYPKPNKSKLHPTMKPVGLLRKLILNSTRIGDVVLDNFGGSGSVLLGCEQTCRRCLMVELDPDYCQTIINRWQTLTGKEAKYVKA